MSINKWIGMGRMAASPELRTTQSGKSVTSFTVAVDRGKDQPVDWIDCVAWEKTAEMICKWFGKGKMIAIVGHLQTRTYEDKQGGKRKATEVVCEMVSFCGDKQDEGGADRGTAADFGGNAGAPYGYGRTGGEFVEVDDDGDLPFGW